MFQGRVGERDGSRLASVKCVSVFSFSASIVHIPMSVESDTKFWLGYLFFFFFIRFTYLDDLCRNKKVMSLQARLRPACCFWHVE